VPAPSSAGGMGRRPRGPGYKKAKRPSGEARLPRGPDRCGRTPTVANWAWASSPAKIMRPPPHLPGNRRGGRSLPKARQSCQEQVSPSGRSEGPPGSFDGRPTRTAGGLRGIGGAGRPRLATEGGEVEVGQRVSPRHLVSRSSPVWLPERGESGHWQERLLTR